MKLCPYFLALCCNRNIDANAVVMRGSRSSYQGVGGGPGPLLENSSNSVFLSPQHILQFYTDLSKKAKLFPRFQRGSNIFREGSNIFSWGPNTNFYRNP